MANRAYLYGLSNRPSSYSDRPETIVGEHKGVNIRGAGSLSP